MVHPGQVENSGVIETIKNNLHSQSIAQQFDVHKNVLLEIGIYGLIGFFTGFLLKKYSEYIIALMLLLVALFIFQHFEYLVITFNNVKINTSLGLQSMPVGPESYGVLLASWVRMHVVSSSSLVIGFLIGLKVA